MRPSGKVGGTVQLLEEDRRMSSYLERQSVLNQGSVKSAFPPEGDRDPSDYIESKTICSPKDTSESEEGKDYVYVRTCPRHIESTDTSVGKRQTTIGWNRPFTGGSPPGQSA